MLSLTIEEQSLLHCSIVYIITVQSNFYFFTKVLICNAAYGSVTTRKFRVDKNLMLHHYCFLHLLPIHVKSPMIRRLSGVFMKINICELFA